MTPLSLYLILAPSRTIGLKNRIICWFQIWRNFSEKNVQKKSRANCFSGAFFVKQFFVNTVLYNFFRCINKWLFSKSLHPTGKTNQGWKGGKYWDGACCTICRAHKEGHRSLGNRREEGNVGVGQFRHSGPYEGCQSSGMGPPYGIQPRAHGYTARCTLVHRYVHEDTADAWYTATCTWIHFQVYSILIHRYVHEDTVDAWYTATCTWIDCQVYIDTQVRAWGCRSCMVYSHVDMDTLPGVQYIDKHVRDWGYRRCMVYSHMRMDTLPGVHWYTGPCMLGHIYEDTCWYILSFYLWMLRSANFLSSSAKAAAVKKKICGRGNWKIAAQLSCRASRAWAERFRDGT